METFSGLISYAQDNVLEPLVGAKCADRIAHFDLSSVDCLKLFVSKVLGLGIMAGGTIVKVPQILKITGSRSTQGLSFASYLLETAAYTISLAYNWRNGYPFGTYGEMAFINIQNLVILGLILVYSRNLFGLLAFLSLYSLSTLALFEESLINPTQLQQLFASMVAISAASKLPQIWNNWRAKSTGQLSAITTFLTFAGSAARVFTTLQEVDDVNVLVSTLVATGLNAWLAVQMLVYWRSGPSSRNLNVRDISHSPSHHSHSPGTNVPTRRSRKRRCEKRDAFID
ncbi:uncharacterized protein EV422DRAFT_536138 [Fimicolochytrium jonesii]|uniref:uncharacterized protein n=1 Tax=Fimicolochytrium jonesii TaxID=1396493 RepID=UPI0022FEDE55|nr:uncharacterized protein EV422DRAFT_536138 [Fimicolochytrium jonesii]KAI8818976.1 hypothetical protein EV422DRAFT_536138 [Fimicolochytrium jonesii]